MKDGTKGTGKKLENYQCARLISFFWKLFGMFWERLEETGYKHWRSANFKSAKGQALKNSFLQTTPATEMASSSRKMEMDNKTELPSK